MADTRRVPKRRRRQLAKAELWMEVAASIAVRDLGATDPPQMPAANIARRYGLTPEDMTRLAEQIGQELEDRAMRAGYEEAWL